MLAVKHQIVIDFLLDEAGNFTTQGVTCSANLQPQQLGLIFCGLTSGILKGGVAQEEKPRIEVPAFFIAPGKERSM